MMSTVPTGRSYYYLKTVVNVRLDMRPSFLIVCLIDRGHLGSRNRIHIIINMLTVLEINTAPRHGFFSAFFGALRGIRHAEIRGYIPEVVWDERSPYVDRNSKGRAIGNAWLQYFEPVVACTPSLRDAGGNNNEQRVVRVVRSEFCGWDGLECYEGMDMLQTMIVLHRKYIRVRSDVQSCVPSLPPNTVGVHYRGTDKLRSGEYAAPPVEALIGMLKQNAVYTKQPFFLATDDIDAFSAITRAFSNTLSNKGCIRADTRGSVHGHYEYVNETRTPTRDGSLKGRQVLVDALCLAQCYHLLRCPSGVSLFSLVAAPLGRQSFMDYTEHTWEYFLHRSPYNVRYHDVLHAPHLWEFETDDGKRQLVRVTNNPDLLPNQSLAMDYLKRDVGSCHSRGQDLFAIAGVHELVSAGALFDEDTIQFAQFLLSSAALINRECNTFHHHVISCCCKSGTPDFLIVCSKQLWEDLSKLVLRPLYEERVEYKGRIASMPLQSIGRFAMLLVSLACKSIGIVSSLSSS